MKDIRIIHSDEKRVKQQKCAFDELDFFIYKLCKKYSLRRIEIIGILESLKLTVNDCIEELRDKLDEKEKGE